MNEEIQTGSPGPMPCSAADGPQLSGDAQRSADDTSPSLKRELAIATKWLRQIMRRERIEKLTVTFARGKQFINPQFKPEHGLKVIQPVIHDGD